MESFAEYSSPSDAEIDGLWNEGIVSMDANVLLSMYDLSPSSREAVLGYLSALEDGRIWVAHQALVEFHRHRIGRREQVSQALQEIRGTIRESSKTIKRQLGRYPALKSTQSKVAKALESASQGVEQERDRHLKALGSVDDDAVVEALNELLDGRTGAGLSPEDVERHGEYRFPRQIPPGFADAEAKGLGRRYGDLHIWLELLQQAKGERRPVLFLTEDSKDDWWWNVPNQRPIPHPELRREMADVAGVVYWQYTLDGFLREAGRRSLIADQQVADELEELREERSRSTVTISSEPLYRWWQAPVTQPVRTGVDILPIVNPPHVQPLAAAPSYWTVGPEDLELRLIVEPLSPSRIEISRTMAPLYAYPPATSETCVVRTPSGVMLSAQRIANSIVFPDDFAPHPIEPGVHQVTWQMQRGVFSTSASAQFAFPAS